MSHRFPSTISAARISAFVSTAAWIQGVAATANVEDVYLPADALNNFIQRAQKQHQTRQQQPPAVPNPIVPEQPESEDDEGSSLSSISDGKSSDTSESKPDDEEKEPGEADDSGAPVSSLPAQDGSSTGAAGQVDNGQAASGLSPGGQAAIAVWVVIFVVASAVAFWWFRRRRRRLEAEKGPQVDPEASRSQPMASQGVMPSILPTVLNRSDSPTGEGRYEYSLRQAQMPASTDTWQNSDTLVAPLRITPLQPPAAATLQPNSLAKGYYDPEVGDYNEKLSERPLSNSSIKSRGRGGVGLPSNPRPTSQQSGPVISAPMMGYGLPPGARDFDDRTVVSSDAQSTIFNWR